MSFCGWIAGEEKPPAWRERMRFMAATLGLTEPVDRNAWFGQRIVIASNPAPVVVDIGGSRFVVAYSGRPRLRDGDEETGPGEPQFPTRMLERYLKHGAQVLRDVQGEFSLFLADDRTGKGLIATDRAGGRHPVSHLAHRDAVIFSTDGCALDVSPSGRRDLDPQGIFNYFYFHMIPAPTTARKGVARLLPGSFLSIDRGRRTEQRYWEIDYRKVKRRPLRELEDEFHSLLRRSVERAVAGSRAGSFLSGGTDSSTLAGVLGEVTGEAARTYSIGFDAEGYDELEYAREAARKFGTSQHEYYLTPQDVTETIPLIARTYAEPFGNASAVPTYFCAGLAQRDGIELLLGGDGGDELFGGNTRYAKQKLFELYSIVPQWLRSGLIEPFLDSGPVIDKIVPLRKAKSYVEQANIPMPRRMETYNHMERFGADLMFEPEFLRTVDRGAPLSLLSAAYDGARADGVVNRMLAMDLKFTLADNDLPKVSRMCAAAGIDVAYPLLDDEMIEFAARLDPVLKVRGLRLRWFFKRALRNYLPKRILTKSKHGFGLPFGVWMREYEPLREITMDSIRRLSRRGLLQKRFLEEIVRLHESSHAAYYGVLIWVLIQLEQWLECHEDNRPGVPADAVLSI